MGLREEIEQLMSDVAGRSDFMLNRHIDPLAQPGDDPMRLIKQALEGHNALIVALKEAVLRLADEVQALK